MGESGWGFREGEQEISQLTLAYSLSAISPLDLSLVALVCESLGR